MADKETGNPKEFRKRFSKYDLVIDTGRIITFIVFLIAMILFVLFMFYLAGVIK